MGHYEQAMSQSADSAPPPCPACGAPGASEIDSVRTADLAALYRQRGIEVAAYLEAAQVIARLRCAVCDLGYFAPPCPGDAHFYQQLQTQSWYYQDSKPEYAYAAPFVRAGQRVLEVGCGKGAFGSYLAPGTIYRGLEFNDEAVRRALDAGLDVRREPVEEHAAVHPGLYDVVCSFQVLEHVPAPGSFIHACVGALAPGGRLIVAVPAEDSFLALAANAPLNMPPHHVLRWSDRALRNLAEREGLLVEALWHEPIASFHRDWQLQTLALYRLAGGGARPAPLIDRSLRYRLAVRLVNLRRIRDWLARRVLRARPELARGHTVVLVASKPA